MVSVGTGCVDEVILTEIVFSGSRLMTKFDQIVYNILIDLIFIYFFCFMVLFQENPNLVKARFV